jgi:hypothetical protein
VVTALCAVTTEKDLNMPCTESLLGRPITRAEAETNKHLADKAIDCCMMTRPAGLILGRPASRRRAMKFLREVAWILFVIIAVSLLMTAIVNVVMK